MLVIRHSRREKNREREKSISRQTLITIENICTYHNTGGSDVRPAMVSDHEELMCLIGFDGVVEMMVIRQMVLKCQVER